jgi:hypothetical protein
MPRGDMTGPNGLGSMTGWGMGRCISGSKMHTPLFLGRRGGQRAYSRRFMPIISSKPEDLEARKQQLEAELAAINEELKNSK